MGEVISIDEARELVANSALWPKVRAFVWDFAPAVHSSWLGESEKTALARFPDSPRVKAAVLEALNVGEVFHKFPQDDFSRICLLDSATLVTLVQWLGALVSLPVLRRTTSGAVVRALKAALPDVYPSALAFSAYFRDLAGATPAPDASADPAQVVAAGCQALSALLVNVPKAVLERLRLKLPREFDFGAGDSREDGSVSPVKPQNLLLLLKLKFPEAYALCS